jgi:GMP synthase (glutamine-hydrolysing)
MMQRPEQLDVQEYFEQQAALIRAQVGSERVLLALSGGVDSSVCAALLSRVIPGQLVCIFVDTGLMRLDEGNQVEAAFADKNLHLIRVDAEARFLSKLAGVTDPEQKRKIIGEEFVRIFEEESAKLGDIPYLAQGTIYPDIIESGAAGSANIKSHHNVGGLPEDMGFTGLVEPLSLLYKDEVRALGTMLDLPDYLVNRQPFPGPGLAVRCIGEITKQKLDTLRAADAIVRAELDALPENPRQYFAVITNSMSVGVQNGERTYAPVIAVRAVTTSDFMTAEVSQLPYELLNKLSNRICTEVSGVSRVVYDITAKPPGTVEWE